MRFLSWRKQLLCGVLVFILFRSIGQPHSSARLQVLVDSLCQAGNFPGLSVALVGEDHSVKRLSSGFSDIEQAIPLLPSHTMPQGSVGKTYAAAIAMKLISQGVIQLDDKVSQYLGHFDWFGRVPNASSITIKMIMNHTSGVMRYEFKDTFTKELSDSPDKVWRPEELISYILDEPASFPAGEGWEYSDTNYILLGMIIERVTGKKYYELVQRSFLKKLKLRNTFPTEGRKLTNPAQGYAGNENAFGNQDRVINSDGLFIINPQFEWTGGGMHSTPTDLARWGKYLYEGAAFDVGMIPVMLKAVPAKLGNGASYGLGVIIRQTPYGITYGHSGFFPGYLTEMVYFPDHKVCVVVQVNSSDAKRLRFGPYRCVLKIAEYFLKN